MRIDRNGQALHQATVWLPAEVLELLRADRFNLSAFVREQIALVYGDGSPADVLNRRAELIEAARESLTRQRRLDAEQEANRERARATVRLMRAEREAAQARQDGIADALNQIIGDEPPGRYARLLPENDPDGDNIKGWEALVRRVSRLCGAELDSAEVANGLRTLVATKP